MFSVPMAIVDFIPVVLFLISVIILQRDLYYQFKKWQFAIFSAGGIMIFVAGLYKAIYKLLYALDICDFRRINDIFFPLQATGFLLIGFAISAFLIFKGSSETRRDHLNSVLLVPTVFSGTMLFVSGMVIGLAGLCISMAVISARLKKYVALILYIVAFFFMLGMGYLSSKDFTQQSMNWIAQGVNIVGQASFLSATLILNKNGLQEFRA